MFYCVILVCVLNRDFACMLKSEKESYKEFRRTGIQSPPPVPAPPSSLPETGEAGGEENRELHGSSDVSQAEDLEDIFEGTVQYSISEKGKCEGKLIF